MYTNTSDRVWQPNSWCIGITANKFANFEHSTKPPPKMYSAGGGVFISEQCFLKNLHTVILWGQDLYSFSPDLKAWGKCLVMARAVNLYLVLPETQGSHQPAEGAQYPPGDSWQCEWRIIHPSIYYLWEGSNASTWPTFYEMCFSFITKIKQFWRKIWKIKT